MMYTRQADLAKLEGRPGRLAEGAEHACIGILTGGGDCPGLNAVIRAVTLALVNEAAPGSPASSAASWAC
jgi:hypothetical protein